MLLNYMAACKTVHRSSVMWVLLQEPLQESLTRTFNQFYIEHKLSSLIIGKSNLN